MRALLASLANILDELIKGTSDEFSENITDDSKDFRITRISFAKKKKAAVFFG